MAYDLSLSTRYLSVVLKHEAEKTTMELIHIFLISEAKNHLRLKEKTVFEIAYELGFENSSYLQDYSKKQTGMKRTEFRNLLMN